MDREVCAEMKHLRFLAFSLLLTAPLCFPLMAQTPAETKSTKEMTPEEIIRAFSEKETKFYEAWMQYAYKQTAEIKVLSVDGAPKNEKETIISDVVFDDKGKRDILIRRRAGNLHSVGLTTQDEEVLNNLQPFALTEKELPLYNLKYGGKEHVDELNCYVFSVKPKNINYKDKNKMYFEGKIWVDDQDLQIVRTVGKPVPQRKNNLFPEFETIRQVIDGKHWFPVWTHGVDDLEFPGGVIKIEQTIEYTDYKKFRANTTIKFGAPTSESQDPEKK
jgi:hypothetical protein